jgi:hypothetical protein
LVFTLDSEQLKDGEYLFVNEVCSVPDKRSRILEVVIVRRLTTWVLGIWRGEGLGKGEKGEVSLQAT